MTAARHPDTAQQAALKALREARTVALRTRCGFVPGGERIGAVRHGPGTGSSWHVAADGTVTEMHTRWHNGQGAIPNDRPFTNWTIDMPPERVRELVAIATGQ